MGEVIFHVFLLAVLGVFFSETLDINTARMTDPIGPAGFPQAIILLAIVMLLPSLFKAYKTYRSSQPAKREKLKELDPGFLAILSIIVVFTMTIHYVGFWFGTAIIIPSVMFILNERKPMKLAATTVIGAFAFTFVFGNILSIPLPRGLGLFESISYFIY